MRVNQNMQKVRIFYMESKWWNTIHLPLTFVRICQKGPNTQHRIHCVYISLDCPEKGYSKTHSSAPVDQIMQTVIFHAEETRYDTKQ